MSHSLAQIICQSLEETPQAGPMPAPNANPNLLASLIAIRMCRIGYFPKYRNTENGATRDLETDGNEVILEDGSRCFVKDGKWHWKEK
jgi:hypothetical protein